MISAVVWLESLNETRSVEPGRHRVCMVAGTKGRLVPVEVSQMIVQPVLARGILSSLRLEVSGFCTILCKSESEPCACASAMKSTGGGLAVKADIWTLELVH